MRRYLLKFVKYHSQLDSTYPVAYSSQFLDNESRMSIGLGIKLEITKSIFIIQSSRRLDFITDSRSKLNLTSRTTNFRRKRRNFFMNYFASRFMRRKTRPRRVDS